MQKISTLIRADREFLHSMETLRAQIAANNSQPIIINGLTGGAQDAYIAEAIIEAREITRSPSLILVGSDSERQRIAAYLSSLGIDSAEFKPREPIFYNISASCDIDRERLSVLLDILIGKPFAVVATRAAALA